MLTAGASGSGKTLLTCGILQALKNRGLNPASFKCGPDYIDPMFHTKVIGTKSRNLDTFFTGEDTLGYLLEKNSRDCDIAVMEGKNGLFARMPCRSYQDRHGNTQYSDTFFPLNANDRTAINEAVLSAYQQELEQNEAEDLEEGEDESEGLAPQM